METFAQRIAKLSPQRLLLLALQQQQRIAEFEAQGHEPVAVIGLACRMPGAANPEEFWDLLERGGCAVHEISEDRLALSGTRADTFVEPMARQGAFLKGIERFDPQFFNISPAEATAMDPQQRILLEVCWEALERSNIPADSLVDTRTGVFVGISANDYALLAQTAAAGDGNRYLVTGASNSIAVGRISYLLGLHGPNMAVDTSCSSSATSVHLAMQSLRRGECQLALAGGVSLTLLPSISETLSRFNMLAADGRCKPFSAAADGFGRGEGCGVVVLKRLKDALRDNDNIVGVIRGSACNSDGRSSGLTAPSGLAQEMVIEDALKDAEVSPEEIDWVEAHGTGTPLGDPVELTALGRAFQQPGASNRTLPISSVKSNINHLEAAAGVAGLIKVLLSMEHEAIPGTPKSQPPNPRFDWPQHNLSVSATSLPWHRGDLPRRAGVSSFGFSGTNVHLIIEEPPRLIQGSSTRVRSTQIVTASAKTKAALRELCGRYAKYLEDAPETGLDDFAETVDAGRMHLPHRLAAVVQTSQEAKRVYLDFSLAAAEGARSYGFAPQNRQPGCTFVFSMGQTFDARTVRSLHETSDVFREAFAECQKAISAQAPDLLAAFDGGHNPAQRVAEFAMLYSLACLLRACGIVPSSLRAIGAGEIAAAAFAGVMSVDDAIVLTYLSASADRANSPAELQRWLRDARLSTPSIVIAGENGSQIDPVLLSDRAYWSSRHWWRPSSDEPVFAVDSPHTVILRSLVEAPTDRNLSPWTPLLRQLATLYVAGASIDWAAVPASRQSKKLVLPTYPFQRERYWLDLAPAPKRQASHGDPREEASTTGLHRWQSWTYETVWQPIEWKSRPLPQPAHTNPDEIMRSMGPTLDRLAAGNDFGSMPAFRKDADALSLHLIARALSELGLPLEVGNRIGRNLCGELHVSRKHERLLNRIFTILEDEGIVSSGDGAHWTVQKAPTSIDISKELAKMRSFYPQSAAEIDVFERGVHLGSILSGRKSGLELLFPNGSLALAENLYQNSTHAKLLNPVVAEVAKRALEALPKDRKLRILEIGAGTGSTSAVILPQLPPDRVTYVFTDLSKFFLTSAAKKFSAYDFVRYALYDAEGTEPPAGEPWGSFDLVIAANVLHATKSLRRTLSQVRKLIVPGGFLLLLEAARSQRLADITLGTIEGWWAYEDTDLRQSSVLIRPELWRLLLEEVGFSSALLPEEHSFGGIIDDEPVILARLEPEPSVSREASSSPSQGCVLLVEEPSPDLSDFTRLLHRESVNVEHTSLRNLSASLQNSPHAGRPLSHVIFLASAGADGITVNQAQHAEQAAQESLATVQSLLKGLSTSTELWFICRAEGLKGADGDTPASSMLRALVRVLETEHPLLRCRLVEYDSGPASRTLLGQMIADPSADAPRELRIIEGRVLAPALQPVTLQPLPKLRFDSAGAYIVTGAFGLLGSLVTRWLAEQGAGTLLLVGHRSPSPQAERQIEETRRLGTRIFIVIADVSLEDDVTAVFRRADDAGVPLRGIFHAAGVLEDAPILGLTPQALERVLAPKVKGAWLLHGATLSLTLDHFVLFSSAAALLGPAGQCAYAMANSFLASLATHRVGIGLPAVAIDWGPWVASGAQVQRDFLESWRKAGGEPIQEAEGLEMLAAILDSAKPHLTVLPMRVDGMASADSIVTAPGLLSALFKTPVRQSGPAAREKISLKDQLEAAPAASHPHIVSRSIERRLIELLELDDKASIPLDINFLELGVDSLVSLELRNEIQNALSVSLPATLFFDYPTRRQLDDFLSLVLQAAQLNQTSFAEDTRGADAFDQFII